MEVDEPKSLSPKGKESKEVSTTKKRKMKKNRMQAKDVS